jgi:hypothetical protein
MEADDNACRALLPVANWDAITAGARVARTTPEGVPVPEVICLVIRREIFAPPVTTGKTAFANAGDNKPLL